MSVETVNTSAQTAATNTQANTEETQKEFQASIPASEGGENTEPGSAVTVTVGRQAAESPMTIATGTFQKTATTKDDGTIIGAVTVTTGSGHDNGETNEANNKHHYLPPGAQAPYITTEAHSATTTATLTGIYHTDIPVTTSPQDVNVGFRAETQIVSGTTTNAENTTRIPLQNPSAISVSEKNDNKSGIANSVTIAGGAVTDIQQDDIHIQPGVNIVVNSERGSHTQTTVLRNGPNGSTVEITREAPPTSLNLGLGLNTSVGNNTTAEFSAVNNNVYLTGARKAGDWNANININLISNAPNVEKIGASGVYNINDRFAITAHAGINGPHGGNANTGIVYKFK